MDDKKQNYDKDTHNIDNDCRNEPSISPPVEYIGWVTLILVCPDNEGIYEA